MPELESMGSIPLAVAAVAMLLFAAAGLGDLCIRPIAVNRWRWTDALLLQLIVGLNLLGLMAVVLGMFGLLARGRSIWVLAGCSLLSVWTTWRRTRDRSSNVAGDGRRRAGRWPYFALLALSVVTLGPALCYPTGWDELVYHELLPQRWLADGWPAFYPDLPYSAFPSLAELLFWLMAPMEGVIAPRLLNWVCWLVGLVCVYRLLSWRLTAIAATVLTLAFTLNDTVLLIGANCYVETFLLMNFAGMMLAFAMPRGSHGAGALGYRAAVLGILAGGSAAVKLTGFAVIPVPILWYAAEPWLGRSPLRAVFRRMGVFLMIALSVGFPFYLRPWLATQNPFYPYHAELFTDNPVRIDVSQHHHAIGGYAYGVKSLAAFLDAPLLLAFRSSNYDGEFGWQLLVLVVLAILAMTSTLHARARRVVLLPAAVCLWLYVFWFVTAQQARFAVPLLVAFTALASLGLHRLHGVLRRVVLATLVLLAVVSIPWRNAGYYWCSWLAVTGRINRTEYVDIGTLRTYLPLIDAIYAGTPADAQLLLLFEHRGFYVPRRFVIGTPLFQEGPFSPSERYAESGPVTEVLIRNRITHVVVSRATQGPDHWPASLARQQIVLHGIAQCVQQGSLQVVWESEEFVILSVRYPSSAARSNLTIKA